MKLLMLDIETAPHLAAVWGLYDQNVAIDQIIKPGYTLCWSAKWYGKPKIHFDSILSGHKDMIRGIHDLMDESDAICHYNGTKFDIPTLNKEFLLLGLKPPAPSDRLICSRWHATVSVSRQTSSITLPNSSVLARSSSTKVSTCGLSAWPRIRRPGR